MTTQTEPDELEVRCGACKIVLGYTPQDGAPLAIWERHRSVTHPRSPLSVAVRVNNDYFPGEPGQR